MGAAVTRLLDQLQQANLLRQALERVMMRSLSTNGSSSTTHLGTSAVLAANLSGGNEELNRRLRLLVDAVHAFDGIPERASSTMVITVFPERTDGLPPQERALRAGLRLIQAIGTTTPRPMLAVTVGRQVDTCERTAETLCRCNLRLGTDLLIPAEAFAAVSQGFIADRVVLGDGSQVFAIKATG